VIAIIAFDTVVMRGSCLIVFMVYLYIALHFRWFLSIDSTCILIHSALSCKCVH